MPDEPAKKEYTSAEKRKLYLRGCITNGVTWLILYPIITQLHLGLYVAIAAGIQYATFLFHGLPFSSEKFYDLSGSITHFAVVAASLIVNTGSRSPRQQMIGLAAVVWMTRLGSFLYLRICKDGRDERFDQLKVTWISFMGAWSFQVLWVVLIQMPIILLNNQEDTTPIGVVDGVALLGWFVGFMFEVAADVEKFVFRTKPENKGKFIQDGVWALCRQPNYFGEILMWCSIATTVSVVAVIKEQNTLYWAWLSPFFTAFLLLKVSGVPMIEAAGKKKWGHLPEYQNYMANTNMLIPGRPAKKVDDFTRIQELQ